MQRLHISNGPHACAGAPGEEVTGSARVRAARVRVADAKNSRNRSPADATSAGTVAQAGWARSALATDQPLDLAFKIRFRGEYEQLDRKATGCRRGLLGLVPHVGAANRIQKVMPGPR